MSLSETLKKVAAGAVEKSRDLAEQSRSALDSAMEKGKGLAEQGKLSLENQKQAQAIADAQKQIGVYVSENGLLADDEFVLNQMSVIAAAQEIVEKNNDRINALKSTEKKPEADETAEAAVEFTRSVPETSAHVCELRFCPRCGAQVRTDAAFCQACGTKL